MNWRKYQRMNLRNDKWAWKDVGYILFLVSVPFILYFLSCSLLSMGGK